MCEHKHWLFLMFPVMGYWSDREMTFENLCSYSTKCSDIATKE